jgi:AcrR family transcriptional regulator
MERVAVNDTATTSARRTAEPVPRRGRGRPRTLSTGAIVAAALALLDREGADALTMRRLGAELGVEAMSLYRHVASRDALLDAIAERLVDEIEPRTTATAEWAEALRAFAGEVRGLARRHPAAFSLVGLRVLGTPSALGPVEDVLASLRSSGFTPARAVSAYRLVIAYARGYALSEIAGFAIEPSSTERQPAIRSLSRRLAAEPTDVGFRAGLETILGGLRVEREAAS